MVASRFDGRCCVRAFWNVTGTLAGNVGRWRFMVAYGWKLTIEGVWRMAVGIVRGICRRCAKLVIEKGTRNERQKTLR